MLGSWDPFLSVALSSQALGKGIVAIENVLENGGHPGQAFVVPALHGHAQGGNAVNAHGVFSRVHQPGLAELLQKPPVEGLGDPGDVQHAQTEIVGAGIGLGAGLDAEKAGVVGPDEIAGGAKFGDLVQGGLAFPGPGGVVELAVDPVQTVPLHPQAGAVVAKKEDDGGFVVVPEIVAQRAQSLAGVGAALAGDGQGLVGLRGQGSGEGDRALGWTVLLGVVGGVVLHGDGKGEQGRAVPLSLVEPGEQVGHVRVGGIGARGALGDVVLVVRRLGGLGVDGGKVAAEIALVKANGLHQGLPVIDTVGVHVEHDGAVARLAQQPWHGGNTGQPLGVHGVEVLAA